MLSYCITSKQRFRLMMILFRVLVNQYRMYLLIANTKHCKLLCIRAAAKCHKGKLNLYWHHSAHIQNELQMHVVVSIKNTSSC